MLYELGFAWTGVGAALGIGCAAGGQGGHWGGVGLRLLADVGFPAMTFGSPPVVFPSPAALMSVTNDYVLVDAQRIVLFAAGIGLVYLAVRAYRGK